MFKISLILNNYNNTKIKKELQKIQLINSKHSLVFKSIKNITVLRAPFINKKSREQFEHRFFTYKLILLIDTEKNMNIWVDYLKKLKLKQSNLKIKSTIFHNSF